MTDREVQDGLCEILDELQSAQRVEGDEIDELGEMAMLLPPIRGVTTFEEQGVLTTDKGLIIRFQDGSEFQVTIVRSR